MCTYTHTTYKGSKVYKSILKATSTIQSMKCFKG